MNTVPWNEVKWAMGNAERGLNRDEICPGLTVDQHAESLAMFDQHNVNTDNATWSLAVLVVAKKLRTKLMEPFNGAEVEN